jgi:hypothetical protein
MHVTAHASMVVAACAAAVWIGAVVAEETPVQQPVPAQPRIEHPYLSGLLGTWNTAATGQSTSTGKAQVRLGLGDTIVMHDYAADAKRPDGSAVKVFGHGMYKVSADGRTMTAWWVDNFLAEPLRLTGPITEKGFDVAGTAPDGKLRITFERTADGHVMKGYMGDATTPYIVDTYKRVMD